MALSFSCSRSDRLNSSFRSFRSHSTNMNDLRNNSIPAHMMNGVSICCYAQLLANDDHFTCSDCSTLFNKRGVMTLKEEEDYCETDISPFEQYREMLKSEIYQIQSERVKGFYRYQPDSSFVKEGYRKNLVQKMFAVGERLKQSDITIHLAVKLMDRVFSLCPDINQDQYDLVANGCIMLAAKFEELDMNIPMLFDMQIANKFKVTYQQLRGVEQELLVLLDFDFMALTPLQFLKQLHATGLLLSSDQKCNPSHDISEKTLFKVYQYALHFCYAVQEHYTIIQQFKPSLVAAGCLYIARKCCQLEEIWEQNMIEYVGYTKQKLQAVVRQLEKELGGLSQYIIDNFREGDALKFNQHKPSSFKDSQYKLNFKLFDLHLKSRGIKNPYQECAIQNNQDKNLKSQGLSRQLESLILHEQSSQIVGDLSDFKISKNAKNQQSQLFNEHVNHQTKTQNQSLEQNKIEKSIAQVAEGSSDQKKRPHRKANSIYEKENFQQSVTNLSNCLAQGKVVAQNQVQKINTQQFNNQRNTLIR
eukprot:403373169